MTASYDEDLMRRAVELSLHGIAGPLYVQLEVAEALKQLAQAIENSRNRHTLPRETR